MATRIVEGKKPYTGGKAITVDENKVISLNLRDENNLIIYDEGDNEIYVDLQLPDNIRPTDAFPVGVTTGRVIEYDDWSVTGTILVCKTTNGGIIKLLYEDADGDNPGRLFIDNGTDGFRQIYFKADVDEIVSRLQAQIDVLYSLGKFLSLWDCVEGEPMSFPLTIPYEYSTGDYYLIGNVSSDPQVDNLRPEGSEWNDIASQTVETQVVEIGDVYIYDGTTWLLQKNQLAVGTGDVIGPASATDEHLAVFDGNTGKIIKDGGVIPTHDTITVTLLANGWSNSEQTVTATGVTTTNTVIVSPDPSDFSDYTDAVIYCSAQGTNSLTFTCDTTPSNDIDVNVVILD